VARDTDRSSGLHAGLDGALAGDRTLSAEDRAFLDEVVDALRRDPFAPADRLARGLCLSSSHFAHRFREVAGVPPGTFALGVRMQEAKHLLAETRLPVVHLALEVGYDSLGTFTSRFTAMVGSPPARFRALLDREPPTLRPVSPPAFGAASVTGRLSGRDGFTGLAFVGLFPSFLPSGRPVTGTLAQVPGTYRLPPCPPGRYRVMAAAITESVRPRDLLVSAPAAVAAGPGPVDVGLEHPALCDLTFRPPVPADPPVVVSLAVLASARVGL
jgi:AraC family transcriptional regulator